MTFKLKRPKAKPPRCPACRVGGYRMTRATDGRPRFTCERCDHTWTFGRDGGEWVYYATSADMHHELPPLGDKP